jgi:hypothetical protein
MRSAILSLALLLLLVAPARADNSAEIVIELARNEILAGDCQFARVTIVNPSVDEPFTFKGSVGSTAIGMRVLDEAEVWRSV